MRRVTSDTTEIFPKWRLICILCRIPIGILHYFCYMLSPTCSSISPSPPFNPILPIQCLNTPTSTPTPPIMSNICQYYLYNSHCMFDSVSQKGLGSTIINNSRPWRLRWRWVWRLRLRWRPRQWRVWRWWWGRRLRLELRLT